jgi:hypothetical protein
VGQTLHADSSSRSKTLTLVSAPREVWQVSREQVTALREQARQTELGPYVQHWLARYNEVGRRGDFLWRWCLANVKLVTLPCVEPRFVQHLAETKMIHLIFLCLIDDIVDERHDAQMFHAALALTQGGGAEVLAAFDCERRNYLELLRASWDELWQRTATYPRYQEFADDLRFDYAQVLQGLWHSLRINVSPARINVYENDAYQPHNMAMVYMAMLDLCASPDFDVRELGLARELFLHGQMMGRIGNTLATWERELASHDYASGMFAHAVDLGVIDADGLHVGGQERLAESLREPAVSGRLMDVWRVHRDKMARKTQRIHSVDFAPYLRACEDLVASHQSGRGLM